MVPLRVVVVDDNATMLRVLTTHLGADERLEVVRTFGDVASLVAAVALDPPDVVVLDNQMPGGDGIDVLPDLRRSCPHARLVLFSSDPTLGELALARGADRFVEKGQPLDELLTAVVDGTGRPSPWG